MRENADRDRRRVTISDVAQHAGVSTASASKVLRNAYGASPAMRARVQASMDELGYRPHGSARGMRGRTFTIGVVLSDIENPFYSLITDGLTSVVRAKSYDVFVSPSGFDATVQQSVIEAMIDHQVDGLILVSPLMRGNELEAIAARVPVVVVGHHHRSQSFDTVAADDELGSQLVVAHLAELGHKDIAFVMHEDGRSDEARPECHRLSGFVRAMERKGLGRNAAVVDSQWSLDGGRYAARQLAAVDPPPTAVYAGADVVALGIMNELWDNGGSVPSTYSLVGWDNSRTSSLGPIQLTTIDQSGTRMGERAGELLLERIDGRRDSRHDLFQPRLVIRRSTAPTK
ncbi:LacI family DNA-binding transcriptional regulator [Paenarthrobacter sp. NPDC089989]|uniref:LacI family DNA-binding transcriptional regulator n=1 Tax=unclassified Paenarthrobacter TaxID=2634190 RepID=UPI00382BBB3A